MKNKKIQKSFHKAVKANDEALYFLDDEEQCSKCFKKTKELYYKADPINDTDYKILKLCEACYYLATKK